MHGVDLYRRVRLACHREGLSRREASRQFGIDRKTVAKILLHSEPPGYRRRQPPKRPKLAPFTDIIDGILEEDRTVHRKQRHTRPPYVFLTALGVRDDRSQSLTVDTTKDIPLRMRQTRMPQHNGESQIGLFCSNQTTRAPAADQMVRWPRKIGQVLKFRLFRQ